MQSESTNTIIYNLSKGYLFVDYWARFVVTDSSNPYIIFGVPIPIEVRDRLRQKYTGGISGWNRLAAVSASYMPVQGEGRYQPIRLQDQKIYVGDRLLIETYDWPNGTYDILISMMIPV